ncbi:hypothetical protein D3C72_1987930 [compost metagenome]
MVPVLPGIVEDRRQIGLTVGMANDLFQRKACEGLVLFNEAVECRDIGLVVLAVVEFQRLGAHAGFGQSADGKG